MSYEDLLRKAEMLSWKRKHLRGFDLVCSAVRGRTRDNARSSRETDAKLIEALMFKTFQNKCVPCEVVTSYQQKCSSKNRQL